MFRIPRISVAEIKFWEGKKEEKGIILLILSIILIHRTEEFSKLLPQFIQSPRKRCLASLQRWHATVPYRRNDPTSHQSPPPLDPVTHGRAGHEHLSLKKSLAVGNTRIRDVALSVSLRLREIPRGCEETSNVPRGSLELRPPPRLIFPSNHRGMGGKAWQDYKVKGTRHRVTRARGWHAAEPVTDRPCLSSLSKAGEHNLTRRGPTSCIYIYIYVYMYTCIWKTGRYAWAVYTIHVCSRIISRG